MTRLTLLFLVAALVLPGAVHAMAAPDQSLTPQHRNALATERYYSSYGTPERPVVKASAPATVTPDRDGLSWTIAIGAGFGLVLLAGGLGLYGGRMVRPRHIGA
jgi:hypothetical protein